MRDLSIRQAFHGLLDNGEYLAWESTVYRVFRERDVNIRRDGTRESITSQANQFRSYRPQSGLVVGQHLP